MYTRKDFFTQLDKFPFRTLFDGITHVWEPLEKLDLKIDTLLATVTQGKHLSPPVEGIAVAEIPMRGSTKTERGILVNDWVKLESPVYFEQEKIYIGAGTVLEPTAIIKGPAVVGEDCEIRQGAYMRGNVVVGNGCTVGHTTEIKNGILLNHTEVGHFNYIGDSILGSHVNLGAGTKLANLQFRSIQEKTEDFIHPVVIDFGGEKQDTGRAKLGAILGDYVEIGCNSVTCPGVLIGRDTWVAPNTTVPKGYYPPQSFIAPSSRKPKVQKR